MREGSAAFQPGDGRLSAASVRRELVVIDRARKGIEHRQHMQVFAVRHARANGRRVAFGHRRVVLPPADEAMVFHQAGKKCDGRAVGDNIAVSRFAAAVRLGPSRGNRRGNGHRPRFGKHRRGEQVGIHHNFAIGAARADGRRAIRRVAAPSGDMPIVGGEGGESHPRSMLGVAAVFQAEDR